MKRFLLFYSILLLTLVSLAQAQEPLWRKSVDIKTKKSLPNRFMNTRGLYYNDSSVFELTQDTLFLYDIKTGKESKIEIITRDSIIDYSPNCRFLIVARNDTMFSYNIEQKKQVFLRKGREKIIHYTINNVYALCEYGQVFNLETGELIRTVTLWGILYANDENVLRFDHTLVNFVTGATKNLHYRGYNETTDAAFSPDYKTIVSYDNNFMYIERLENDSVKSAISMDVHSADIERCEFIDTVTLVVFKNSSCTKFDIIDTRTGNALYSQTEGIPTNVRSGCLKRLIYPGYRNIAVGIFGRRDDCGGMPVFDRYYYHVLIKPKEKNPFSFFPDNKIHYKGALSFTDENKSLSFISKQNTIETFNASNGDRISSWDISSFYLSGFTQYAKGNKVIAHKENLIFQNLGNVYLFSLKNGTVEDSLVFSYDTLLYMKPSADGKKIICVSMYNHVHIIDRESFSRQGSLELNGILNSVALSNDTLFYTISGSKYVKKYNIKTQQLFDSIFVESGVKILGSEGVTYIPENKIEITRLKDNIALKNLSLGYQMGYRLYFNIAAVDNIPGYWKIHENLQSSGDDEGYGHIMTMQEQGDTLIYQKKWKNTFRCFTNDIVFSDNGQYCATISDDAFEVHSAVGLISSVNDEQYPITEQINTAYYVDGNTLILKGGAEYQYCTLYSLTGEKYGECGLLNNENKNEIILPTSLPSGIYTLHLYNNKTNNQQRIIIAKK